MAYRGPVPELPELRAHAERIWSRFADRRLTAFEPLSPTALKTVGPDPAAVGAPLRAVGRRGKHLLLGIGEVCFVVHMMQGGRLVTDHRRTARPRQGLARWSFDEGPALLLTEAGREHRAGVWVVAGDPLNQPPLWELGPDADVLTRAGLAERLGASRGRLHGVLHDQRVIAGLGRRLANEVCHRARLSPFATAATLDDDELDRLDDAIRSCLAEGLAHERTLEEMPRSADRPGAVHRRRGTACPVCGDIIRAVEYRAYEIDYCPTCQTGGRILADNTTSRFLR